jgi:hypothetical protein
MHASSSTTAKGVANGSSPLPAIAAFLLLRIGAVPADIEQPALLQCRPFTKPRCHGEGQADAARVMPSPHGPKNVERTLVFHGQNTPRYPGDQGTTPPS